MNDCCQTTHTHTHTYIYIYIYFAVVFQIPEFNIMDEGWEFLSRKIFRNNIYLLPNEFIKWWKVSLWSATLETNFQLSGSKNCFDSVGFSVQGRVLHWKINLFRRRDIYCLLGNPP